MRWLLLPFLANLNQRRALPFLGFSNGMDRTQDFQDGMAGYTVRKIAKRARSFFFGDITLAKVTLATSIRESNRISKTKPNNDVQLGHENRFFGVHRPPLQYTRMNSLFSLPITPKLVARVLLLIQAVTAETPARPGKRDGSQQPLPCWTPLAHPASRLSAKAAMLKASVPETMRAATTRHARSSWLSPKQATPSLLAPAFVCSVWLFSTRSVIPLLSHRRTTTRGPPQW